LPRLFRAAGVLLLGLLTGAAGCQHPVQLVSWDGQCGVVAIPNNSDTWPTSYRGRALNLMAKQCPGGYTILGEDEVVLKEGGSAKGYEYEYDGALAKVETRKTEHRIRFCALAHPEEPPPPPGPRAAAHGVAAP
jgi:hypothetical protein